MPKFLEDQLKQEARKKGFTGRRAAHYVYGGLNNEGVMRGNQETQKGRELERKHEEDERRGHLDRGHVKVQNRHSHAEKLRSS